MRSLNFGCNLMDTHWRTQNSKSFVLFGLTENFRPKTHVFLHLIDRQMNVETHKTGNMDFHVIPVIDDFSSYTIFSKWFCRTEDANQFIFIQISRAYSIASQYLTLDLQMNSCEQFRLIAFDLFIFIFVLF